MKNGDLYNGYFENGLINGKGNIIYENGDVAGTLSTNSTFSL